VKTDFIESYPTTPNRELAARFGVAESTILRWARQARVRKDPAYWSQVQRQRATARVLSGESRAKIAAKAQGRTLSETTRAKIRQTKLRNGSVPRGPKHYKWKGGRPWVRFRDPLYQLWRSKVLERDQYRCQNCGRNCQRHERGLAAHHVKSYADHPELRYEMSNGVTLCGDCHMALHGRARKPREAVCCACGCGATRSPVDQYSRTRRFLNGHSRRGSRMPESSRLRLSEQRKGRRLSKTHRAKVALGLRASSRRIGRPPSAFDQIRDRYEIGREGPEGPEVGRADTGTPQP